MSTESKKYRSEMRAKANRLGNSKSPEKVDASSWTPGKPLNADKKTGARPLRARIYKAGGRVQGDRAPLNAGKAPRANGGASKAEKAYSDQNEGKVSFKERMSPWNEKEYDKSAGNPKNLRKPEKANGGALSVHNTVDENKEKKGSFHDGGFKKGGKTACGGGRMAKGGEVKKEAPKVEKVVSGMLKKVDIPGDTKVKIGPYKAAKTAVHKHDAQKHKGEPPTKLKKGGEAEDSMGGRVERAKGGSADDKPRLRLVKTHSDGNKTAKVYKDADWNEYRVKNYVGGEHRDKADYHTDDLSDAHDTAQAFLRDGKAGGGRAARAKGGRTKGKTNINIIIGSGAGGGQQPNMPPPGAPVRPPPPPQNAPPPPMMGGPPPGPPPGGPPPGPPPGGPPGMPPGMPPGPMAGMPRARGGRAGYMSSEAGAGSGLGRLRKVHAAGQHTPGFKGA